MVAWEILRRRKLDSLMGWNIHTQLKVNIRCFLLIRDSPWYSRYLEVNSGKEICLKLNGDLFRISFFSQLICHSSPSLSLFVHLKLVTSPQLPPYNNTYYNVFAQFRNV